MNESDESKCVNTSIQIRQYFKGWARLDYRQKTVDYVPINLLEKFNVPQEPIVFQGYESRQDVAPKFVIEVTEIARRAQELLKTNKTLIMTGEKQRPYMIKNECNLCKKGVFRKKPKNKRPFSSVWSF